MARINICYVVDRRLTKQIGVSITSLLMNTSYPKSIRIFVIHENLKLKERFKLLKLANNYDANIEFIEVDRQQFIYFKPMYKDSYATYFKILIPKLLNVAKIVYIDSDTLVLNDINSLYRIKLGNYKIAAVLDYNCFHMIEKLNLPLKHYFNTGVMLMNLDSLRSSSFSDKAMLYINENPDIEFHEQDAINFISNKHFFNLDFNWNVMHYFYSPIELEKLSIEDLEPINVAINNPKIVHFTGQRKPWKLFNKHPLGNLYLTYAKESPFKLRHYLDFSLLITYLKIVFNKKIRKIHEKN